MIVAPILSALDVAAMLIDMLMWFGIAVGVVGVIGLCLGLLLPPDL